MGIKNIFIHISGIFKFAFIGSMVFAALFFSFTVGASAVGIITLGAPTQNCLNAARFINLSWTSDFSAGTTYTILRKKPLDAIYTEIGSTINLSFQDNTVISDQNYKYQIKVSPTFSNEVTINANYCPTKFIAPATGDAECKNDGPRNNLSWIGASGTVLKYEIYRKNETAGDLVFSKIGETLPGVTVYSEGPGIIGINNYSYFIRTIWQDTTTSDSEPRLIVALACPPTLSLNSSCNAVSPGGPVMNLSWNNLLGVTEYKIYRNINSTGSSLLVSVGPGVTAYADNLISALPVLYWENANIGYSVKAIWGIADNKVSTEKVGAIMRCAPFLSVNGVCDDFGNPAMNLSWTKTKGTDFYYNKYKDNTIYLGQQQSNIITETGIQYLETVHTDNLTSAECPGGKCTHNYRVDAKINALTTLPSNTVSQDINCALNPPPSPAPEIIPASPSTHCESGKSIIDISWSSSDHASYYTLYRKDQFGTTVNNNTSVTSFKDSSVAGNTQYTYYLVAQGRGGSSTGSSKSIVSANCAVPSIPVLNPITKSCVSGNPKTSLSWSSTINTIDYDILRKVSSDVSYTTVEPSYTALAWDDTNVFPSTSYDYQIKAKGAVGVDSALSIVRSITTDSCAPATPVVTLTNSCPGGGSNPKVNISWTVANLDNVVSYEVYREGEVSPILLVPKSGLNYSFGDPSTTLTHGGTYNYKVVAIGYNSKKTSSALVPITLYNCVLPGSFALSDPPTPLCFGPQPRVQLLWTNSANVSTYNLLRARSSPATLVNVASPYTESLRNSVSGNALSFNGSSYLDFGLTSIPLTGDLTIEFWANPSDLSYGRQNPICKSYGAEFCLTMETNGQLSYYHGSAGSNNWPYMGFGTANVFQNNKWVHVIITRNNATRTMKSYKNGSPAGSTTWTSGYDPVVSSYNLLIGKGYVNNFKGIIDEVRIYNRVLSDTEALDHYNGIYTNETNLIGLWHFDEGSGQVVSDSSTSGNNGTLGSSTLGDSADPAWSIREISPQTDYDWTVIANNFGGVTSSNTITSYRTPDCPPARPNLVFTPQCSANKAQMKLSWPYSINAVKYEIYRDGNATPVQTINQNIDPALRTWTDTNSGAYFADNSAHTYKIKAITANNTGIESDVLTVTNIVCSVLPGPINLIATSQNCSFNKPKVKLTWNSVTGASYYKVYRTGGAGPVIYSPVYTVPSGNLTTDYDNSNLDVSTAYTYSVRAVSTGGVEGSSSDGLSYTAGYCNPLAPTINGATSCELYKPKNQITWTDATSYNTDKYEIWRDTDNNISGATLVKTVLKTDAEFNFGAGPGSWYDKDPALLDAKPYYYWVKAVGFTGYSTVTSTDKLVTTLACAEITMSSSTISAVFSCSAANTPIITVSWASVAGATSYNLYKGSSSPLALYLNQTGLSYADNYNSVLVDTAYNYTVRGKNDGGQLGPESSPASTVPLLGNYCPPSKPAISSAATACDTNSPSNPYNTISWTDATDFNTNKYKIYQNTVNNFGTATSVILDKSIPADFAAFNAKTWIHSSGLADNQDYFYWVQAIGPAGTSVASDIATKKTLPCAGLAAPTGLTVTPLTACSGDKPQLKLDWVGVAGATSYTVKRNVNAIITEIPLGNVVTYTDSGLDVNKNYTYSVKASNGTIMSFYTAEKSAITGYCAPSAPVLAPVITDCVANKPQNTLSWTGSNPDNTSKFLILRDGVVASGDIDKNTLSWTDNSSSLANLTTYTYKVRAVGYGTAGNTDSVVGGLATTFNCGVVPGTPTLNLAPGSPYCWNDNPYADFTWSNIPNAYSYNLYRNNVSDSIQSSYSTIVSPETDSGSKVMQFDGVDDYVNIDAKPSFNLNKLTIALWVKTPTNMGGIVYRNLVSKQGADRDYNLYAYSSDGTRVTSLHFSSNRWGSSSFSLPTPFAPDTWHQVAITVNANGLQKYYYDGNFLNQYSGVAATAGSAYPLRIGRADNYWKGLIDDVRIYNRDLSALEIADIFNGIHKNEIGLIGMWHFDEKSGTTVIDSSGMGNDGKIAGPEWVNGKQNNALDFGGIDGYVISPNMKTNFLDETVTIEAWFNAKSAGIIVDELGQAAINTSWHDSQIEILSTGEVKARVWSLTSVSLGTVSFGTWNHVALRYNKNTQILDGFLNGVQSASSVTGDRSAPWEFGYNLYYAFGATDITNLGNGAYFPGLIDEVRIYNRALSATEVMEHKNGIFNNNTELKALWHFDEKSGTIASDSSSFGNNATLIKNAAAARVIFSDSPAFSGALGKNKSYSYYARGIGSDMESNPSNTISFTTSTCEPKKPIVTLDSQCNGASTQVLLSWAADVETSYWTVYKVGFPAFTKNITNNYYLDKDVASGASYQYYIQPFGKNGNPGITSDTVSVIVNPCYDAPVRPATITSASCAGIASKMIVDWSRASYGKIVGGNLGAIGSNKTMIVTPGVLSAINVGSTYKVYLETQTSPATISVTAKSSGDNSVTYDVVTALVGGNGTDTEASILSNINIGNGIIGAGDLSAIGFNKVMSTTPAVVSALVTGSLYKVNLPTQTSPATIKVTVKSSSATFTYDVVSALLGGNGLDTNASIFSIRSLIPYDSSKTVSYNIYRKNITDGESVYTNIFPNLSAVKREAIDGGVVAGKEYSYIVEAIGSNETILARSFLTPDSAAVSLNCTNIPPFYPPDLSLNFSSYAVDTGGIVSLGWTDARNETKYKVFKRIKGETQFAYYNKEKGLMDYLKSIFGAISNAAYSSPVVTMIGGTAVNPNDPNYVFVSRYGLWFRSEYLPYIDPLVPGFVVYTDSPGSGIINYIDRTVNENTIYEYQILAINNAGGPDMGITYSNIVSPVNVPIALPGAFNLSYATISRNKVKLQWTASAYSPVGGPPTYTVQKDSTDQFNSPVAVAGCIGLADNPPSAANRECTDASASSARQFYRVVAGNNGGQTMSNTINAFVVPKWKEVIPR